MNDHYFKSNPYIIELLTPKQNVKDIDEALEKFTMKYNKIMKHDSVISIPDNPMGNLHFTALEVISFNALSVQPENIILHLNTFHRKIDLVTFLNQAAELGIKYILCISGDGSPKLPKLEPDDLHTKANTVTSIELIHYIRTCYHDQFILGVAFNQYEPSDFELHKLEKKIDAGAEFIISQPVIDNNLDRLLSENYQVPVYPGAWMSKKIHLLYDCVGLEPPKDGNAYDPTLNLEKMHAFYKNTTMYLSLLPFKKAWKEFLPYYLSTTIA